MYLPKIYTHITPMYTNTNNVTIRVIHEKLSVILIIYSLLIVFLMFHNWIVAIIFCINVIESINLIRHSFCQSGDKKGKKKVAPVYKLLIQVILIQPIWLWLSILFPMLTPTFATTNYASQGKVNIALNGDKQQWICNQLIVFRNSYILDLHNFCSPVSDGG